MARGFYGLGSFTALGALSPSRLTTRLAEVASAYRAILDDNPLSRADIDKAGEELGIPTGLSRLRLFVQSGGQGGEDPDAIEASIEEISAKVEILSKAADIHREIPGFSIREAVRAAAEARVEEQESAIWSDVVKALAGVAASVALSIFIRTVF